VGARIAAGERISAVVTSVDTQTHCERLGIPIVPLLSQPIAVGIDGADEVAPDFALTKGGGGALFREKIVALAAARFVVIVDGSKLVERLGRFPTPVEVVPFALPWVLRALASAHPGATVVERVRNGAPFRTDNGNVILDCAFGAIDDPKALDASLRQIVGVVSTGLFFDIADVVLVAEPDGVRELTRTTTEV
jgi:ribose 5-phosphate isomerase A